MDELKKLAQAMGFDGHHTPMPPADMEEIKDRRPKSFQSNDFFRFEALREKLYLLQEEVYAKGDPPYWKDDEVGICIVFPSWDRIEGRDENAWYVNFVSYQLGPERRYSWQGTTAKDMLDAMEAGIEELCAYHTKGGGE